MRKDFSVAWKASKQTRKQRKYIANAPKHIRQKMLSSHLSKDLRKKYNRRSFPLRKNDIVKVMTGSSKGKSGKVSIVDLKKQRIVIEGIQITKKEGSKVNLYFKPSNVMITELNLDDKRRMESIRMGKEGNTNINKTQEKK